MSRYIKNTMIAAALQSAIGTAATPTGAANAVLVTDFSLTPLDAQNIDRNLLRGFFGGSEQLVGPGSVKLSYSVELAGSGTAGTAPAWGKQLQACAVGEGNLATPARTEYSPVSTGLKAMTQYYYDDGVLHKLIDCMGDFTISAKVGDRPLIKFDWIGLDGGVSVASDTGTFTPWKRPVAMTKANVVDIILGGTYSAGAVTGGTSYSSTGVEIKAGNVVNFTALLSNETVDITDRASTGSIELDLTPAQEVALMGNVKGNVTQSLALTIGTTAGNKITIFAPAVQFLNPKPVDKNGKRLIGFDLRYVPVNGNDEFLVVVQ